MSYFPRIYQDEYLYSVILRYDRHSGINNIERSFEDIFGNSNLSSYNEEKMVHFDNKFKNVLELNLKSLLLYNTSSILSTAFKKERERDTDINYLFKFIYPPRIKSCALDLNEFPTTTSYLKYCIDCYSEDIAAYVESYYRTEHQYQGNLFCRKHTRILSI